MENKNALREGFEDTLFKDHHSRLRPIFQRTNNGLEITDWILLTDYIQQERDIHVQQQVEKKAKKRKKK
ncbi:hypothetical protein [Turicibacter sanguinis]|jgi:hypothetical protein|uniref:hypothetical protein n=1 Tax=Turicibacter sanguinis TaxID=154288 RepID=UPI00325B73D5